MADWGLPRADGSYAQTMRRQRADERDERRGVRVPRVVVAAEDQDEVYAAQVAAPRKARQRKGRGICSGWADEEEDYGPRYT